MSDQPKKDMTAQTEPAVLSAEMAAFMLKELDEQGELTREESAALRAIANKTTLCKSSAAEAADRARIAAMAWRPIAEAPKGYDVLLFKGYICIGDWGDYCEINAPGFTHFMELPEPPK